MISLKEITQQTLGELSNLEGRMWRTLLALAIRPGKLTIEFLQGHRVQYTPPFRLYVVTSIWFFVGMSILGSVDSPFENQPNAQDSQSKDQTGTPSQNASSESNASTETVLEEPQEQVPSPREDLTEEAASQKKKNSDFRCEEIVVNLQFLRANQNEMIENRVRRACRLVVAKQGEVLVRTLFDKLPTALLFFLPLMAIFMKLLYPLSQRLYVEHLLYLTHLHSFVFVGLFSIVVVSGIIDALPALAQPLWFFIRLLQLYMIAYLFLSLRAVYGQSKLLTAAKSFVMLFAYSISVALMFAITLLIAIFSI